VNSLLVIFIISSIFYFFSYPEVDNDLWGHLFFGGEILRNGELLTHNLYSYTAPDHDWINHEWLAEVVFYGIYTLLGSPGLVLLKVFLGAGIVWILNLIIRKRVQSPMVRTLTLVWAMAILSPGFNVRPQIFTYLLFTAFLFLFDRYQERGKITLYWMTPLTVLWANLHGGFIAGLGALGIFSLWASIKEYKRGTSIRLIATRIYIPGMLSVLFLGLNPYGTNLLKFLWQDLQLDRPITEWEGIPLLDFSFLEFKLALLFILLFSLRSHSWFRWDFILTLLAAFFAFRHQRHTPLFAVAVAPLLAVELQRITQWAGWTSMKGKDIGLSFSSRGILSVCVLGIALLQIGWIGRVHSEHRLRLVVNPSEYPTQAADFLLRNGVRGNTVVPFDWGEYFIWKLYPAVRVSIDGRYTTAYPMEVIDNSWEWMRGGKGWRRLLEHYPAEIAVTKRHHPVTSLMRADPEWVYIYSDPIAFIFVRETPGQKSLLERFKARKLLPPNSPSIYFPG